MRVRGSVLGALGVALVFAAPAMGQGKNVQLVKTIPEGKWATAINFLEYGGGHGHGHGDRGGGGRTRDVMLVTGRFGLKSYSLEDPAKPQLLDEISSERLKLPGDPDVDFTLKDGRRSQVDVLAERGHGRRSGPQAGPDLARPALLRGHGDGQPG